jgi:hypothetical protein
VVINGNIGEWRDTFTPSPDQPRLPLPYAFGAATINAGFKLSAIDVGTTTRQSGAERSDTTPFHTIFPANELAAALRATDVALVWGRLGVSALLKQVFLPRARRRVFYFSYVWEPLGTSSLRQRGQLGIVRQAARLARGVVLMTAKQAEAARAMLPRRVPVVELQVGIDCGFYARPGSLSDIAEADRARVERLLQSPYVIMPGDELRLNDDALAIVEGSRLSLVRISQYGHKNGIAELKTEIKHRNLADRLLVFERVSYPAMRFLMSRAVAYAGLVDATWQPAGWTVACESLASGLPVVLYEGLTSTELKRLGAGPNIVRSVPMRDTKAFASELQSLVTAHRRSEIETDARTFATATLNLETTGAVFGERLAKAARAG